MSLTLSVPEVLLVSNCNTLGQNHIILANVEGWCESPPRVCNEESIISLQHCWRTTDGSAEPSQMAKLNLICAVSSSNCQPVPAPVTVPALVRIKKHTSFAWSRALKGVRNLLAAWISSGTLSRTGKLSIQRVHLASTEGRKACSSVVTQICFRTKFSQSWGIPFCADKHSINWKIYNSLPHK